jgi:hypothetical protein
MLKSIGFVSGHRFSDAESLRNQMPLQGAAPIPLGLSA